VVTERLNAPAHAAPLRTAGADMPTHAAAVAPRVLRDDDDAQWMIHEALLDL
jgi:hypothetical protein